MNETTIVYTIAFVILSIPYAYGITIICAEAFFRQKLIYQKEFFKQFNFPYDSGDN